MSMESVRKTFDEIKEQYPDFMLRWRKEPAELRVPGGERLVDVQRRAWAGLNRIVAGHEENETVVVVSHNFPIIGIICHITRTHLDNYRAFRVEPCGHTRLHLDSGAWRVTHINGKVYMP